MKEINILCSEVDDIVTEQRKICNCLSKNYNRFSEVKSGLHYNADLGYECRKALKEIENSLEECAAFANKAEYWLKEINLLYKATESRLVETADNLLYKVRTQKNKW